MNNENETEVVEHKIKIDDNTELRLKIPVELDAMEFTSILEKSRRVLKVSEIGVGVVRPRGNCRSNDQQMEVVRKYEECDTREKKLALAEEIGTTLSRLTARVTYYKRVAGHSKKETSGKRGYPIIFSDKQVIKLIKMRKDGKTSPEIAEKLGFDRRQISDKITNLKQKERL